MNLLADKLKRLRERHKLTQQELEKKSGVSLRTITILESGAGGSPKKETLRKLLDVYDLEKTERIEIVIAWLRSEIEEFGEDPNKIYMRKAEGMKGNERLLHLFHSLADDEKEEFLKAMERSSLVLDTIRGLNRTWERLLKEAEKIARKIAGGEKKS